MTSMGSKSHVHGECWTGPWIDTKTGRQYMFCLACYTAEYRPKQVQKIRQLMSLRKTQEKRATE